MIYSSGSCRQHTPTSKLTFDYPVERGHWATAENEKPLADRTAEGRFLVSGCLLGDLAGESGHVERVNDFLVVEIAGYLKGLGVLLGGVFLHTRD